MDVYYGERTCAGIKKDGSGCNNKAYYLFNGIYVCGVHSKKDSRVELSKNPDKGANKLKDIEEMKAAYLSSQRTNQLNKRKGHVMCTKMSMMKEVNHTEGYLSVYPNKKHGNRKDGLGLPALSPMNLGPIDSKQPNLPISHNLENFWYASKLFPSQILCKKESHDDCDGKCFRKYQIEMFTNSEAERHNKHSKENGKKVFPLGWLWTESNGTTKLFKYVESRQFYCNYYERLVKKEDQFKKLINLMNDGMNLNIIGYDGINLNITLDDVKEHLNACYLDGSKPFGHELCLMTMLVFEDEEDYPWRKHKTENF